MPMTKVTQDFSQQVIHALRTQLTVYKFSETPDSSVVIEEMSNFLERVDMYKSASSKDSIRTEVDMSVTIHNVIWKRLVSYGPSRILLDVAKDVRLQGDPELIEQLIFELIENALKHSSGEVGVMLRANDKRSILEVTSSSSLPKNVHAAVKNPLVPSLKIANDVENPYCLGLAIADAVARAHGGQLSFHPDKATGSTTVRVTLDIV